MATVRVGRLAIRWLSDSTLAADVSHLYQPIADCGGCAHAVAGYWVTSERRFCVPEFSC